MVENQGSESELEDDINGKNQEMPSDEEESEE